MSGLLYSNFATSTLASGINSSVTTLSVQAGDAALYPAPGAGEWFPVVVVSAAGVREIMRCTSRTGAVLTVTRGQEGTSAVAFSAGARVDCRLTALALDEFFKAANVDIDTLLAANSDAKVASQKAVKTYIDSLALNLGKRARVRAATTANITIATALNNADTLDGVTLATGDWVLVKNQTAPAENGVFEVGVTPVRVAEFDAYNEHPGSVISVAEGTANADTLWLCTSNAGGTIGVTALVFVKLVIAGELLSANNLSEVASALTSFNNIKQAATDAFAGTVELSTDAEAQTGTDTARAMTPANSRAVRIESFVVAVGDEVTALTTGVAKVTFRMPYAFTLSDIRASLNTVSSSGIPTVDVNEAGATILSTKLTIDVGEKTSVTAAVPKVISDASLADDAEITIDIDVAGTGAKGLKVAFIGRRT